MTEYIKKQVKCELYHDNFQNFKRYNIPKAQLGWLAYRSNPKEAGQ